VPATRSRSENWRQSLEQIHERNGSLEITLPRYVDGTSDPNDSGAGQNVIWRVRILSITDDEIQVEEPMALGQTIRIENGIDLVAIIAIGQNRWMFRTKNLGRASVQLNGRVRVGALRLAAPVEVERCQRRNFYRVGTVGLVLPKIECFPVLDPASVEVAEAAVRVQVEEAGHSPVIGRIGKPHNDAVMPHVGPPIHGTLMNIGGGGVGVMFEQDVRGAVEGNKLYWLRLRLEPHIPAPIGVAARVRHTHIDSTQRLYAGMMFEFGGEKDHQDFIVEQLCKYVAQVQREQLKRQASDVG